MKCGTCKKNKKEEEFSIDKRAKRGRCYRCKDCDKAWREKNIDKVRLSQQKQKNKYYKDEEERIAAKKRVYEWRYKKYGTPEERLKQKILKEKKILKEREKKRIEREYRKKHITPFIKKMRTYLYYALNKRKYINNEHINNAIGCDINTLVNHIEKQFYNGMTWDNKGKWHLDHIIPFSSAKTLEEVIKLCHYTNLQPLWECDHVKKRIDNNEYRT